MCFVWAHPTPVWSPDGLYSAVGVAPGPIWNPAGMLYSSSQEEGGDQNKTQFQPWSFFPPLQVECSINNIPQPLVTHTLLTHEALGHPFQKEYKVMFSPSCFISAVSEPSLNSIPQDLGGFSRFHIMVLSFRQEAGAKS